MSILKNGYILQLILLFDKYRHLYNINPVNVYTFATLSNLDYPHYHRTYISKNTSELGMDIFSFQLVKVFDVFIPIIHS